MSTLPNLEHRLEQYKKTEVYLRNNYPKDIVSSIVVAINILEIAMRNSTKIRKEDHFWFNGSQQITRLFDDDEWQDVAVLYDELSTLAKSEYF